MHGGCVGFLDGNILIVILGKIVPCEQGLICRMAAPRPHDGWNVRRIFGLQAGLPRLVARPVTG